MLVTKFYLNLGYKLKKKALCYSHLNNTVDILDRNIVMDYFRHENHWQSSQKKKNNNKFEENKGKKSKSRRNNPAGDFDEGKLKSLKQANRLSNMFDEQDGGMLDYYDLTTERGRRGKKRKNQKDGPGGR